MSRNRFHLLLNCFHFSNNALEDPDNRLAKIQPLIDKLKVNHQKLYISGKYFVIDVDNFYTSYGLAKIFFAEKNTCCWHYKIESKKRFNRSFTSKTKRGEIIAKANTNGIVVQKWKTEEMFGCYLQIIQQALKMHQQEEIEEIDSLMKLWQRGVVIKQKKK